MAAIRAMSTNNTLIQYVVIRSDLKTALQWPFGALMAQACHACTAVTHLFYDDPNTKEYLADLDRMHKCVLEIKDEDSIKSLASILTEKKIDHKLWIEQPENIPTCLVTKPYPKSQVQSHFRQLKLYKG